MSDHSPVTRTSSGFPKQGLPLLQSSQLPVAVVELDAAALNFLLSHLPQSDGYTQDLEKLRDAAKEHLWSRY